MSSRGYSLASRLRAGDTVYSGWCALGAPIVAEAIAREGFVAVTVDRQHGLFDGASAAQAIAAIAQAGATPVVRVPLGDHAAVSHMLDLGAGAIIAPMIDSAEDAARLVAAAKFPPLGGRSWGPNRAAMLAGIADTRDYLRDANATTLAFAMIETRQALDHVAAIAAVPGIDGLFVGPSDLSIALSGGRTLDPHAQEVDAALDIVLAAARSAGKIPGLYCTNAERALASARRGFRFIAAGSDLGFLRAGIAAQVGALRSG